MTAAAFFDVDNTLVKGSSLFLLGRGLVAHKLVRRRDVARYAVVQARFRLRGEHLGHIDGAQDTALALGAGLRVEQVVGVGRRVYQERVAGRLWPQTVALADAQLAAGLQVWLVSAAPLELVEIIAEQLGLTGALGTTSQVQDGRWTGRLASPILHGPAKATAVRDLAADRGLSLADSHAYTDSVHDIDLLHAVGHPHAVNPDRHLARLAAAHNWPVHRHRNDLARTAYATLRSRRAT